MKGGRGGGRKILRWVEGKRVEDDTWVMRRKEGKESKRQSEGKVHEKAVVNV